MHTDKSARPIISVVIPTYNRGHLVRRMLDQLLRQSVPVDQFEVIVSDDGSSDGTAGIVESYADRLRLKYHFQEDRGMRVGMARNAGARLAAGDLLAFLDGGVMLGPDLLARHLAAHADAPRRRAVMGYAWGYDPRYPALVGLDTALDTLPPEQVLARYRGNPGFRDVRHDALAAWDFDLATMPLPWQMFFTINCSVPTAEFRATGGFDETIVQWGAEDLEIGFRLARAGLDFHFTTDAWVIEWPHERDMAQRWPDFVANMGMFLRKFPEPVIELGYVLTTLASHDEYWRWVEYYLALQRWSAQVAGVEADAEIAQALARVEPHERVAVFGAGGTLPPGLPPADVVEFDRSLLDRSTRDTAHTPHHAIGIRTVLPDQSVDTVIITSRLAGLWPRWGEDVLAEARRIGRKVELPVSCTPGPAR